MPVERFPSGEEMNAAPIRAVPGNSFDRFVRHCGRYWKIFPRRYPRGVYRFRTLDEAQAARDRVAKAGNGSTA